MNKIIAEYYCDSVEITIGDNKCLVFAEDLSEIADLINFIGENLNIEIEEKDLYE